MKTLEFQVTIKTTKERLWSAWTSSQEVSKWFAPEAKVHLKVGGAFELFFIPGDEEHMNTKGCTITELAPFEGLSFTWRGPDDFAHIMNVKPLTVVKAKFMEEGVNIKVNLTHGGWGQTQEWDEARKWHEGAWHQVLSSLKEYLECSGGSTCCGI